MADIYANAGSVLVSLGPECPGSASDLARVSFSKVGYIALNEIVSWKLLQLSKAPYWNRL